ncbi:hypothetical protein HRbin41_01033 [bacterium HR41]|nr:hypothetical protein HRbin41_01033 [bacterium HR41]
MYRRAHPRPGRGPIVSQPRCAPRGRNPAGAAVEPLASFHLGEPAPRDGCDRLVVEPDARDDPLVDHAHAAARDGTEGELFVPGHAELAHDQNRERRGERVGHLARYDHTTAWQAVDNGVAAVEI